MDALTTFDFEEQPVRVQLDDDGQPWWVAADVCRVLEIATHRDAVARLDEDERGSVLVDTLGGIQSMSAINEPGLFSLVLTSRKDAAKRFKRWVCHEVLPAIRRTGAYAPESEPTAGPLLDERRQWITEITRCQKLFGIAAARWLWRRSTLPQPPMVAEEAVSNGIAEWVEANMERRALENTPLADVTERYNAAHESKPMSARRLARALRAAGMETAHARNGETVAVSLIGWRFKDQSAELHAV